MGRFQRAVGVVILGVAVLGAVLLWLAVSAGNQDAGQPPREGIVFGVWQVLYDTEAPSSRELASAIGLALLFAAGVAFLERRIATRSRRTAWTSAGCRWHPGSSWPRQRGSGPAR